jgi:hypothetical protein
MTSIMLPLVRFEEKRAINRVAIRVATVYQQLSSDWSRQWLEITLRKYLRGGLISVIKVVEAADAGDEIADAALREVGGELVEAALRDAERVGRPGDLQIIAYFQRAAQRAPHGRRRGKHHWSDHWSRNLIICMLIHLASNEFGIKPTRNRESTRAGRNPSGCSLVTAGLARNGVHLKERSIQQNIWLGLPGELFRLAVAERPIETLFSVS